MSGSVMKWWRKLTIGQVIWTWEFLIPLPTALLKSTVWTCVLQIESQWFYDKKTVESYNHMIQLHQLTSVNECCRKGKSSVLVFRPCEDLYTVCIKLQFLYASHYICYYFACGSKQKPITYKLLCYLHLT
jgi:hypothetical protein